MSPKKPGYLYSFIFRQPDFIHNICYICKGLLKKRVKGRWQILCSFCKKGIKTLQVTEESSVVQNIFDCGNNHELCMCPCTSNANAEDKCFDKCCNNKGF